MRISGAGLLLLLLAMLGLTLMSAERHPEAPEIRRLDRDGLCEGMELYYSVEKGTVLLLCGVPDSDQWAGTLWRVTENMGLRILTQDEAYEVTMFMAKRAYWNREIAKYGYMALYFFPDVENAWNEYFR